MTHNTASYSAPSSLSEEHDCDGFNCGHALLNEWLRRHASQNQRANAARTFVVCREQEPLVIGYYSLAVGAVDHAAAPACVRKGLARHPIPAIVLARLAVDISYQRKKIGRGLLKDAILRTLHAADIAGIRAIFVHAQDDRARGFYERFGFESSPLNPQQLMLMIKECREIIGKTE